MAYHPFYSSFTPFSSTIPPLSPNPYGYGYSSHYNHDQQPPLPYSQPQPPPYSPYTPPYSNPYTPLASLYSQSQPPPPSSPPLPYSQPQPPPLPYHSTCTPPPDPIEATILALTVKLDSIAGEISSLKTQHSSPNTPPPPQKPDSDSLPSIEASSLNGDSVEQFIVADRFVVHGTPPPPAAHLGTEAITSPTKWKSIKTTEVDKQSTISALKSPPLEPPSKPANRASAPSLSSSPPPLPKPPDLIFQRGPTSPFQVTPPPLEPPDTNPPPSPPSVPFPFRCARSPPLDSQRTHSGSSVPSNEPQPRDPTVIPCGLPTGSVISAQKHSKPFDQRLNFKDKPQPLIESTIRVLSLKPTNGRHVSLSVFPISAMQLITPAIPHGIGLTYLGPQLQFPQQPKIWKAGTYFRDPNAEFVQKEQQKYLLIFLVRIGNGKQWDPGGYLDMFTTVKWSQFKQWDPGKFIQGNNFYNLEDKVGLDGVWNDRKTLWASRVIGPFC